MLDAIEVMGLRFIPAWAGNTMCAASFSTPIPVHPRVGGEHLLEWSHRQSQSGSSPRGRGTLAGALGYEGNVRFIPAWAGNTLAKQAWVRLAAVHPRVGGEHR